jgi:hypothetical protein
MIVEKLLVCAATGEVVNHIVIDDEHPPEKQWQPPDGHVLIDQDGKAGMGFKWDGTKFIDQRPLPISLPKSSGPRVID